ncbi:integral membrane transport protein [Leucobacter sp. 7(1)]|uniref:MFS transporter n=1 Tax=Leucobacter sp. 7(1) TaxID=1255613 RepID=UPI00097ECED1|nr:MFS transporter [Leucobacter sp. 7(1)]SJN11166.1 integral membrane transport protein [Leucobacter sp. 7(1)]
MGKGGADDGIRPRLGVVLTVLCVTEVVSWGLLYYAFTVLAPAIGADTGWAPMGITAAFSGALAVSAVTGIPVGKVIDRHGPRGVMTGGSLLAVAGLIVVALAPNVWVFAGGWLLTGAAMAGTLYPPAFAAITGWFTRRRLGALATLTLAAGLASTIFAPITAAAVEVLGWRGTYLAAAGVLLAVTVPLHAWALHRPWPALHETRSEHAEPVQAYAARVVRSSRFVLLTAGLAVVSLAMYAALIAIVPLMLERGLGMQSAAWVLGLGGLGQVAGRLLYTAVAARASLLTRTAVVFALVTVSTAALAVVPGPSTVLVGLSILAGVGRGIATLLQATAITDRWGPRAYGHLSAVMGVAVLLATAIAPWAGTFLAWAAGSYATGFAVLAGIAAVGTILLLLSADQQG